MRATSSRSGNICKFGMPYAINQKNTNSFMYLTKTSPKGPQWHIEKKRQKENNKRTQVCVSERNQDTWNKCSTFSSGDLGKRLFVISRRRERPPTDLIFRGLDHVISMLIATSSTELKRTGGKN